MPYTDASFATHLKRRLKKERLSYEIDEDGAFLIPYEFFGVVKVISIRHVQQGRVVVVAPLMRQAFPNFRIQIMAFQQTLRGKAHISAEGDLFWSRSFPEDEFIDLFEDVRQQIHEELLRVEVMYQYHFCVPFGSRPLPHLSQVQPEMGRA